MLIAGAGNETATRLISWTGKLLAEHPDQRREIVEDRSLVPGAIEEILRYEAPVAGAGPGRCPATWRCTGSGSPRGASWCCSTGRRTGTTASSLMATGSTSTATMDTTSASDTASTSASAPRSARVEGRVALDEVLDRWPEWEIDWDGAKQAHTAHVRGWEKLPVNTGS